MEIFPAGRVRNHGITYSTKMSVAEHKSDFKSQRASHTSPSRASYGVSIVMIFVDNW